MMLLTMANNFWQRIWTYNWFNFITLINDHLYLFSELIDIPIKKFEETNVEKQNTSSRSTVIVGGKMCSVSLEHEISARSNPLEH